MVGGGRVETSREFLSNFFDHEVKIADRRMRGNGKAEMVKPHGKVVFAGKLIVLVDSRSTSASKILARVVQLEKRGTLLGDRSEGALMESVHYNYDIGFDIRTSCGASFTEAGLIMTDGKSLEKVGVTPDEMQLPGAKKLAAGRDPVIPVSGTRGREDVRRGRGQTLPLRVANRLKPRAGRLMSANIRAAAGLGTAAVLAGWRHPIFSAAAAPRC